MRVGTCLGMLFFLFTVRSIAQNLVIEGQVLDSASLAPIELVTIFIDGTSLNAETDQEGFYRITMAEEADATITFSRLGYETEERIVRFEGGRDVYRLDVFMKTSEAIPGVTVTDTRLSATEMVTERAENVRFLPSTTGNLESVLPHIALGVRSGTGGELTSQYNVRGGNYDENLVYVNDFEIFRPQLIRSSQQEGLSFPNPDLINDLSFSSGGYQSKYGDKMASVLDIRYKRPEEFRGSVSGSLLGGTAHIEGSQQLGATSYNQFRYLVGTRYKTTRYLLGSLDVEGEFTPDFVDFQGYFTYDITRSIQAGMMLNYNQSRYDFIPKSRATALGLVDFSLMLTSVFEGKENDVFRTGMAGGFLTFIPERDKNPLFIKLLASGYRGLEKEQFDISGFYRLSQVETDLSSGERNEEVALLGIGTEQDFARNRLYNEVANIQLKGGIELQSAQGGDRTHFIQWGAKWQREFFDDRLNEWERIDSAGYSIPFNPGQVLLNSVLKSENVISSNKITGYIQDTYSATRSNNSEVRLTMGTRFSYWSLNKRLYISPRFEMLYKPPGASRDITYKLAGGVYHQLPFYRELRRLDGTVNNDIKAQRAIHVVAGLSQDFKWESVSDRPFRFILEAYYKKFTDLITFDIDNVRIRYSGENDASGHAIGLDARLNGEFVPGAESWINLSFLRVRESLMGVDHQRFDSDTQSSYTVGSVPRPTDQLFSMSIFFQDYLPRNENIKVNLNFIVGTGLPFGLPGENREFRNIFRYRAYRRVDMGFSWQLWNADWRQEKPGHFLRAFKDTWLSLEVFNLIGIENVSSNTWIKTILNQQFAVPNNLTNRRVNLRLRIAF